MSDINFDLTFRLMELANEAYNVLLSDKECWTGYRHLDGTWSQYYDRNRWLEMNHFTLIENPKGDTPHSKYWGIVTIQGNILMVAFRGTDFRSWEDIAVDTYDGYFDPTSVPTGNISFKFASWDLPVNGREQTVWVHKNFLAVYQSVQSNVRQTVDYLLRSHGSRITDLYVTGHSLGGALASLCALDIQTDLNFQPKLMTFASPLVGNKVFADFLNQCVPTNQRFAIQNDYVTAVPTRGWTPQWQEWYDGGQKGPQPCPKFVKYVHAGEKMSLASDNLLAHYLTTYYAAVEAIRPSPVTPRFHESDPVNSLVLRIKTAGTLFAGTDLDISVNTMGVDWGVLDKPWHNDFERGSIDDYDLFQMFPNKKPSNPKVGDIKNVTFTMGKVGFFDIYSSWDWKVEYVDIIVNGETLTRLEFNAWLGRPTPPDAVTRSVARERAGAP